MRKPIHRLLLLSLMLGFGLGIQAQTMSKEDRKKANLRFASEHLLYQEYEKALPYVDELLSQDPANAYYNFWMGKCLYHTYKKNMALVYLEKVNRLNPDVDDDFHYYYGLALHYNFKFDDAVAQYRLAMQDYTPGSEMYNYLSKRISQCTFGKTAMRNRVPDADMVIIENAGESVNTPYAEHSPVISANDSILLWTARRPDCLGAIPEENFYDEDLYISFRRGEIWSEGENIGRPVNSPGHDATISLTADGRTLYIYRHKEQGGIYVTNFDTLGNRWEEPKKVEKPLNSRYYEACLCVSADGSKLFFTSDRPGGYGGRDIYMVRRTGNGEWGEPENLGPKINTPFDDDAPYFHPDGKTLYYSSNGPKSIGGFDIFVTEFDETQNTWIEPLNMGYPVNTPDDDIYFVLNQDGRTGYYSSGKEGGFGEKDIYSIELPYYPYPRRNFIVKLASTVVDTLSGDTLDATVRLIDRTTGDIIVSRINPLNEREYNFMLNPEHEYVVEAIVDGYPPTTTELVAPKVYDRDIKIRRVLPVARQAVVTEAPMPDLMHIYYDFDKYGLREESRAELNTVAQILKDNPDWVVELHGHTDWYNTVQYNQVLSMNRCLTPRDYLIKEMGIEPDRVVMLGFTENKPIDSNDNDEGRQYNRRTEFKFFEGGTMVYASTRLRRGVEGIRVDHTTPKGEPGYDTPEKVEFVAQGAQPEFFRVADSQFGYEQQKPKVADRPFRINLVILD